MGLPAIILLVIGYHKGQGQHISGVKSGLNMAVEILPLLILAFIVAGIVQVLLPVRNLCRLTTFIQNSAIRSRQR